MNGAVDRDAVLDGLSLFLRTARGQNLMTLALTLRSSGLDLERRDFKDIGNCQGGSVLSERILIATLCYSKNELIRFEVVTYPSTYPPLISFFSINVLDSA